MNKTKIDDVVDFIKKFAGDDGIPIIGGTDWEEMNTLFKKEEIKEGMAEYISKYSVLFPFRHIPIEDAEKKFRELRAAPHMEFIMRESGEVVEKYDDYKYPYSKHGKFVISFGHYFNDISNYYQQRNRYDCGSHGFVSPNEYWYSPDLLKKMNWTFWRMEDRGINHGKIRGSFRLGAYVATQFKPQVAKTIFDFVKTKVKQKEFRVLDFSMGWGDRLAGFYTSSATHYLGTDPNPQVFRVYKDQCVAYEKLLSGKEPIITYFQKEVKGHLYDAFRCTGASGKEVIAYNAPAEDILDVIRATKFDCIFTSPPYFATELYDEGGDDWKQSWFRYQQYDNWWSKFYQPVITACYESLTDNGAMMINIMDPQVYGKRYNTCDQMVDHIVSLGGTFDGQIGMRIKQRPKNIASADLKAHLTTTFIENIWCFSKNGFDLSPGFATLEGLFGE
jgi:hypothetical protein